MIGIVNTIKFDDSGGTPAILLIVLIFMIFICILIGWVLSYDSWLILHDFVGTALVLTDKQIIIVKARPLNENKNLGLGWFVLSDNTKGPLSFLAASKFIKNTSQLLSSEEYYKNEYLSDLTDEKKVLDIIDCNNSNYYINVYENTKLLRETKKYYLYSCEQLMETGSVEKKKLKVYKVYNNLQELENYNRSLKKN